MSNAGSIRITSEPGSTSPSTAAAMASDAPTVTSTPVSGSNSMPYARLRCAAIACRSARMPGPGGYWLTPWAMACCAASSMAGGPSSSGKPWPRLTASRRAANADIAAKMLTAKGCNRWTVAAWPATLGTVTARA